MVEPYLSGRLMLDELVTETKPLEGFRDIVEDMEAGKLARGVLNFWIAPVPAGAGRLAVQATAFGVRGGANTATARSHRVAIGGQAVEPAKRASSKAKIPPSAAVSQ